jgi:hypothetical protein
VENMAQVSISEAARLAGCTRANLYKSYINQGKLSVTHDHLGKPRVDTAELLRVFGSLQGDSYSVSTDSQKLTADVASGDTHTDTEIKMLREQLEASKEREQWYRQQIGELTGELSNTRRLLEHQRPAPFWQRWFK